MPSITYNSFPHDVYNNLINPTIDTFKVMLVTSSYVENKATHSKRSHVTNEVSGAGYTAGGATVTITVQAIDNVNNRIDLLLGSATWSGTITARKAVYYKSRGGAASADELVMVNDFGSDITSTNGVFTLNATTLRLQN